jgi:2-dehydro-3-deoxyphosphogluconate aldolase / (4S)-4-hydroxy-2-oxoglutarate aldolase
VRNADLFARDPVIPIATIEVLEDAVPLARAVHRGGLSTLEVTLRTPVALAAIEVIARAVPGLSLGAGTVLSGRQAEDAKAAGARFLVTPGATETLLDALEGTDLPFLCGCATPSEIARLVERGITEMKLFPAEAVGGVELVKALAGPFPGVFLCPTGGIDAERAREYLALPNVAAVGGTWVTRREGGAGDWNGVAAAARAASRLRWTRR